jgi:meso-butanediol dehydrogenase/(S,S)-butanediol dehydrogenase/diacetyl reductase
MTPHGRFDGTTAVTIHGRGVFLSLKQVLPRLVDGGAVVNAASIGGRVGSIGLAPHVASKHAVLGLTRTAALEMASRGIRVKAVCPGPVQGGPIASVDDQRPRHLATASRR